jgi:hypothetical protein
MSKTQRSNSKPSPKHGRHAASGKFVAVKSGLASPSTAVVIEKTSKRYSKALKQLAEK